MKQKINVRLVLVAILSAVMTMFGIIFICYGLLRAQVKKDLETTAGVLAATGIAKITDGEIAYQDDGIRITWIASDGSVLYDNDVSVDKMTNHIDRPEVQEAFQNGEAESVRKSDTMNMKTFYRAILLSDGTVLRVSTEARSMISVFMESFPIMLIIILVIIVICIFVSHLLTKQLFAAHKGTG